MKSSDSCVCGVRRRPPGPNRRGRPQVRRGLLGQPGDRPRAVPDRGRGLARPDPAHPDVRRTVRAARRPVRPPLPGLRPDELRPDEPRPDEPRPADHRPHPREHRRTRVDGRRSTRGPPSDQTLVSVAAKCRHAPDCTIVITPKPKPGGGVVQPAREGRARVRVDRPAVCVSGCGVEAGAAADVA